MKNDKFKNLSSSNLSHKGSTLDNLPTEIIFAIINMIRIDANNKNQDASAELSKLRKVSKFFMTMIDDSNFGTILQFQKWHKEIISRHKTFLRTYDESFEAQIQAGAFNHNPSRSISTRVFKYDATNQRLQKSKLNLFSSINLKTSEAIFVSALFLCGLSLVIKSDNSIGVKAFFTFLLMAVSLLCSKIYRNKNQHKKTIDRDLTPVRDNNKEDLCEISLFLEKIDLRVTEFLRGLNDLLIELDKRMAVANGFQSQLHDYLNKKANFGGINLQKCIAKIPKIKENDFVVYSNNIYNIWLTENLQKVGTNESLTPKTGKGAVKS